MLPIGVKCNTDIFHICLVAVRHKTPLGLHLWKYKSCGKNARLSLACLKGHYSRTVRGLLRGHDQKQLTHTYAQFVLSLGLVVPYFSPLYNCISSVNLEKDHKRLIKFYLKPISFKLISFENNVLLRHHQK